MVQPVPLRAKALSFIDKFVDLTEGMESPSIFRRWSAITCVSGALERKVWSVTWGTVYPNLFVVLTANPGIGKTVIIELIHRLWTSVSSVSLNVAPTTVTKAGLIDHYAQHGLRTIPGTLDIFSSCLVPARELGHLIAEFDLPFLNTLNDFYDCNDVGYKERTRKLGIIELQPPHMVLLAGAQPAWIASVFPEAAFAMGTAARLVFVYSGEVTRAPLWTSMEDDAGITANPLKDKAIRSLLPDLDRIAALYGLFKWTAPAKALISEWIKVGCPPSPTHHRLRHYTTRRPVFILKLAMVFSAAEGSDLIIHSAHVESAMNLLFETESWMPEIFKEMSSLSGESVVINDLIQWMHIYFAKRKRPIAEARIMEFLTSRLPANQIKPTIEALINSNLIKEVQVKIKLVSGRFFVPTRPEDLVEKEDE